jgi:hypothetical protein
MLLEGYTPPLVRATEVEERTCPCSLSPSVSSSQAFPPLLQALPLVTPEKRLRGNPGRRGGGRNREKREKERSERQKESIDVPPL